MDFINRAQQSRPAATNVNAVPAAHAEAGSHKREHRPLDDDGGKWFRITSVLLALLVAIVILALIVNIAVFNNTSETKYLNKNDYQAVFVNVNGSTGGQVYFGHIQNITNQAIDLTNVFYIQNQGSASSNSSYTLVKLGCELHAPTDQMVINASQVYFWENLKPNGQVAQKIAQYYRQNPNGQVCTQTSTSSANQSSTNTQPSTSNSSSSTTTTPTTTKKP